MLSLQQLAEIAARHLTAMADAMVVACVAKSIETGEVIVIPERSRMPAACEARPTEDVDWVLLVEGNTDTPLCHV